MIVFWRFIMEKRKEKFHGKEVYLLGKDEAGIYYWLESPSRDCDWYWGFGYIETYTRNENPQLSRDITSHSHADSFMSEYFTDWNGGKPTLTEKTFNNSEGWELSELFKQFYFLRDSAENLGRGQCNCGNTKIGKWKKPELVKEITEKLIPAVTKRILQILSN